MNENIQHRTIIKIIITTVAAWVSVDQTSLHSRHSFSTV